jgi:hypothetical protein
MPSLVAEMPLVRMECRRIESESRAEVPAGGPSLKASSRLDLRAWEESVDAGLVVEVAGRRVPAGRWNGVGASLLARVRDGRAGMAGMGGGLSCSFEAFAVRPERACRRPGCCVDDSAAWDFAVRRARLLFSGDSGSLIEAGSGCARFKLLRLATLRGEGE